MLNPEDLSLKDLKYLLTVAEEQGFVKAADTLNVSQPALSKQIKRLEKALDLKIFERSKRQFFVTESGQEILNQAQRVLDEADQLIKLSKAYQAPFTGKFSLGIIASACAYLLPYFVAPLKQAYPQLKLSIQEGLTDQLVEELKQGKLDAIIAATTFEDTLLNHIALYFEPFVFAYKPDEQLKYPELIDAKAIDKSTLLLLDDGHCLKDQTLGICSLVDTQTDRTFRATSLETLIQMIASGVGTAILPLMSVISDSRFKTELGFSKLKNKSDGRTMALYFRKTAHAQRNMMLLSNHIQSSVDKLQLLSASTKSKY